MGHTGFIVLAIMAIGALQADFAVGFVADAMDGHIAQIETNLASKVPTNILGQ